MPGHRPTRSRSENCPNGSADDLDLASGSVVTTGRDFIELSQNAARTITLDDGSMLTFGGVEKLIR